MRVDTVNGQPMEDIITWRWEADGSVAELTVFDPADGEEYLCELEREPGQDWGVEFTDVLFDGIRTCVNACQFCFMAMLPKDARASLMLRDDDYRLSFLQGNFVTLTNVSDEDVERIITCRLEPMNVSIHAVSPEVRVPLIGRHAMRGMEVLERLCDAGIEIHGQIVLCAGINDGAELERTLAWVEAHPQVTSLAIVPLGYTKYSKRFSSSFSEDAEASRAVVRMLEPYQRRAREELGITRFQLSDEFYLDADLPIPGADTYDGYPQFYDGIGMLRYFLDEAEGLRRTRADELRATAEALALRGERVLLVCGEAARGVFAELCRAWGAYLSDGPGVTRGAAVGSVEPFAIRNDYYGGDVNVTGLIVACDLLAQLPADLRRTVVVLPEVMFNFDKVTLDGVAQAEVVDRIKARGGRVAFATPNPPDLLDAVAAAL
jgi:putative radical SAM enzyme (TIGR03279 family)